MRVGGAVRFLTHRPFCFLFLSEPCIVMRWLSQLKSHHPREMGKKEKAHFPHNLSSFLFARCLITHWDCIHPSPRHMEWWAPLGQVARSLIASNFTGSSKRHGTSLASGNYMDGYFNQATNTLSPSLPVSSIIVVTGNLVNWSLRLQSFVNSGLDVGFICSKLSGTLKAIPLIQTR